MSDEAELKMKVTMDASQSEAAAERHKRLWTDATGRVRDEFGKFATAAEAAAFKASDAGKEAAKGFGGMVDVLKSADAALASFTEGTSGVDLLKAGFHGLKEVVQGVTDAHRSANAAAEQSLATLLKTKDAIREIQSIKDKPNDDRAALDHFALRNKTGMDQAQAKAFAGEFAGTADAFKGKNISEAEYDRLEGMSARFAKSRGGDASAMGGFARLTGTILGTGKFRSADDLMAQQSRIVDVLAAGAGGDDVLGRAYTESSGTFLNPDDPSKGALRSGGDLAALIATASRTSPTQATDIVRTMHRALTPDLTKTTGKSGEWAGTLKGLGVTEQMDDTERLGRLFGAMQGQEMGGRSPEAWLKESGLDGEAANRLKQLYTYRGFLGDRLTQSRAPLESNPMARVDERYRTDVGLRTDMSQQRLETYEQEEQMPYQMAPAVFNEVDLRLKKQGYTKDSFSNSAFGLWNDSMLFGKDASSHGWDVRREQEANKMFAEKGMSLGAGRPSDHAAYQEWVGSGEYKKAYGALAEQERIGGTPMRDPEEKQEMEDNNGLLQQAVNLLGIIAGGAGGQASRAMRRPTPPGGPSVR